jgi:hypothetical protein
MLRLALQFESFQVRQFCALSPFAATTKVFRSVCTAPCLFPSIFDLFFRAGKEIHSKCRLSHLAVDSYATRAGTL